MKHVIVIIGLLLLCLTVAAGQSAPQQLTALQLTHAWCIAWGTPCTGANQPFNQIQAEELSCAMSPPQPAGSSYPGKVVAFCTGEQNVIAFTIDYTTSPPKVAVIAPDPEFSTTAGPVSAGQFAHDKWGAFLASNKGLHETHVAWNPFIHKSGKPPGAFVWWGESPYLSANSSPTQGVLAVSTSADPTSTWNAIEISPADCRALPTGSIADPVVMVGFSSNGLTAACNSFIHCQGGATYCTNIWYWNAAEQDKMATSLSPSNNHIYGLNPRITPTLDYTLSKSTAVPDVYLGVCDPTTGATCERLGGRDINLTVYAGIWSGGALHYNAHVINFTRLSGYSYAGVSNPILAPNNTKHGGTQGSAWTQFPSVQIGSHVYYGLPLGKQTLPKGNAFLFTDVDVSNPKSPAVASYTKIGGTPSLDATYPAIIRDAAGNIIVGFNATSPNLFSTPGIMYRPAGSSTLAGPFYMNQPTTHATLANINDAATVTVAGMPGTTPWVGFMVPWPLPSATTLVFEGNNGTSWVSATAQITGGQVTTAPTATSTTTGDTKCSPGNDWPDYDPCTWSVNATGYQQVRMRATAITSPVAITAQQIAAAAPTEVGGARSAQTVQLGVFGSMQTEFLSSGALGNNFWWTSEYDGATTRYLFTTEGVGMQLHRPVSVSVSPGTASKAVGLRQNFTVTTTYLDSLTDSCPGGTWSSSDLGVATIDSGGTATVVGTGTTDIKYACPLGDGSLVSGQPVTLTSTATVLTGISSSGSSPQVTLRGTTTPPERNATIKP